MRRSRLVLSALVLAACRATPPPPTDSSGPAPSVPPIVPSARVEMARPATKDGGLDPVCEGEEVALFVAALDERCGLGSAAWDALAAAAIPDGALRQEATVEPADAGLERIVFRLRNAGATALDVPVRVRPGRVDLAAFSVLAEDARHGVYELAPPRPDLPGATHPRGDAGIRPFGTKANPTRRSRDPRTVLTLDAGDDEYVHSARIRILPGGVAIARLVVDPAVAKRLDPGDGGTPPALHGRVTLHIGQLIAPYEAGEPARIDVDLH